MKKQYGFTLIELMIVMAIIAILVTAGIQAYTDYIKKARDSARLSIANQVETAVNALMGANNGVPPDDVALLAYLDTLNMTAAMDALDWEESPLLSSVGSIVSDFVGGPPLYALIREPSGGRSVCLGYDVSGNITRGESCAFRYIVYGDNTYVVGYGVEHESSLQKNFYKIATGANGANPQYMQVKGTAQYVGTPSIGSPGGPLPTTTTAFGASRVTVTDNGATVQDADLSSQIDTDRSAILSTEDTGGGGGGGTLGEGQTCATSSECAVGVCINYHNQGLVCRPNPLFGQCSNDAECGDGYICSTYNGCTDRQIGSPCVNNSYCDSGFCYEANAPTQGGFDPYTCTTGAAGVGCGQDINCQPGLSCILTEGLPPGSDIQGICASGGGGGSNFIIAGNTWMTTDLSGYYQWMRKTAVTSGDWPSAGSWIADSNDSDYGDPCEAFGGRMPTQSELNSLTAQNRIDLGLTMNGYFDQSNNGILTEQGNNGVYWSSNGSGSYGYFLFLEPTSMSEGLTEAALGGSVRCIQN